MAIDRPRFASGASRWRIESNASFPRLAARPTAPARRAAASRPLSSIATTAITDVPASTAVSIVSSRTDRRTAGASAEPASVPRALAASTTPNHHGAVPVRRNEKAIRKVRNPTVARSRAMADAARMIPPLRSSARSWASTGVRATDTRGRSRPATVPAANTHAARATTTSAPSSDASSPGMAAANPTRPPSSPSLALASTSSASLDTVVGTSALFDTWYPLPSTSTTNASGNSTSESRFHTMAVHASARPSADSTTMSRRPPAMRSMAGPISGATSANGATVNRR